MCFRIPRAQKFVCLIISVPTFGRVKKGEAAYIVVHIASPPRHRVIVAGAAPMPSRASVPQASQHLPGFAVLHGVASVAALKMDAVASVMARRDSRRRVRARRKLARGRRIAASAAVRSPSRPRGSPNNARLTSRLPVCSAQWQLRHKALSFEPIWSCPLSGTPQRGRGCLNLRPFTTRGSLRGHVACDCAGSQVAMLSCNLGPQSLTRDALLWALMRPVATWVRR